MCAAILASSWRQARCPARLSVLPASPSPRRCFFVYLFVGVAHNVWCLDEAVASTLAVAMEKSPDRSDDSLPKAGISLCDHCPSCVPALMPEPASVAVRSALAAEPVVMTTEWIVAAHPRLETPPPKFLT